MMMKILNAFCVNDCPSIQYDKKEYENKKIILNCIPTLNNQDCSVTVKNYYKSKSLLKRFCFPSITEKLEFDNDDSLDVYMLDEYALGEYKSGKKKSTVIINKDFISSIVEITENALN